MGSQQRAGLEKGPPVRAGAGCTEGRQHQEATGDPGRRSHGLGGGSRLPKDEVMERQLQNVQDLLLQSCPVPGCAISGWWGTPGSYCTLWAEREEAPPSCGGQRPWEEETHDLSYQGPRQVGVPGTGSPSPLCPLFHILPSPLPSSFPPSHKLLLVLFWTLEIHR